MTFILISGNIGVGKTTTVDVLSKTFALRPYHEAWDLRYFDDYRRDPARWAFHAQVEFFLESLLKTLSIGAHDNTGAVQDRGPAEMINVFARYHWQTGNLSSRDFAFLRTALRDCENLLPRPSVLLHLTAPSETLLERISLRGRASRERVDGGYLDALADLYDRFVQHWYISPVVVVDTQVVDPREPTGRARLADLMHPYLR